MKKIFIIIAVLLGAAHATQAANLTTNQVARIAAAIYKLEGGIKTKYPFGIRSVDTGGDYAKAQRICKNTIKNNFLRWEKSGQTNDFLTFLGSRYCSAKADLTGSRNWQVNIHRMVKLNF